MPSPHPVVCYLLVHLLGWCPILDCMAQGKLKPGQQLGSILVVSGLNSSKDQGTPDPPAVADQCRGYYDVMGQFDPPFSCNTGIYNYCCGTCGYRYCCQFKEAKLDQSGCSNYGTPNWANVGNPPPRPNGTTFDHTRDKTNLIVYFICGVVAIMVLVGIFTKLGLEKSHRPQRELNVSRALTDVLKQQGQCTANHVERDGKVAIHVPPENMQLKGSRNNFDQTQMNNAGPTSPLIPQMVHPHSYPTLEQQVPGKELNKYASLKAVAEKANDDFLAKRQHFAELAAKGTLPLHPVQIPVTHEVTAHSLDSYNPKLPGQKNKMTKMHTHPLAFETDYKSWDTNDTTIRRQAYANKRPCTVGTLAEPHSSQPQHYMPQQPYFVTNSKTEVTV
ncbi:protein shisa-9A [Callorhinchus milii]|uniref:Shisa family member 9b n=1 Tax=Callorhinchus milii TaxID=7868 RepID=A0A4W3HWV5_CALMI|nr:protein shisa-9A [Callorhinchus milii]|eukprot:gi/632952504/ref/XP_007891887.1/ PREDICTED: protein shisa-9 [Callorhinchus milii]